MTKLYWEDFKAGAVTEYGPRLVTREEIVAFAAEFDPQPMHMDEEAARSTLLGGLAASGWHSCCIMMRMIADGFVLNSSCMGSPGVDEVKWLAPVRPGMRLTLRMSVRETRVSKTWPNREFVNAFFELFTENGECVVTQAMTMMFGCRPAEKSGGNPDRLP